MSTDSSKISVVINTKNAAKTLAQAIQSVAFADEVIVMDMESNDETKTIARHYQAKVFNHPDVGYVEPARNAALAKASNEWILVIDADEAVPKKLASKLASLAAGDATADAYRLARKNIIFGNWLRFGGWWPDFQLRFFRKGAVKWSDTIHEQPSVKGSTDTLPAQENLALTHFHYSNLEEFIQRLNRYTSKTILHQKKVDKFSESGVIDQFGDELLRRLFQQEGIKDGMHGIATSWLQSMYQVIVFLKHWQAASFPKNHQEIMTIRSLRRFQKQTNYWIADWHVKHSSGIVAFWWRVRRKFQW